MKLPILTPIAATSIASSLAPLSAAFTVVDFSDFATWDASNPDPSTLSATSGPLTYNNVLGIPGCTLTLDFSGGFTGGNLVTGSVFDNRVEGSNTFTVTFGSIVDFQIEQLTHHGPDETDILTVGGGAFDPGSFTILNDTVPNSSGPLPAVFAPGNTSVTIGAYPWNTGDTNTNAAHPEWTIDGTGSSFTFTHETAIGDGNNGFNVRNSFQFFIDTDSHLAPAIPEPSRALLLGLGSLALFARRRR